MAALVIMCHRKAPGWWLGYHGGVLARWIYGQQFVNIKYCQTKQEEHNTNHLKQAPSSSIGLSLKIIGVAGGGPGGPWPPLGKIS